MGFYATETPCLPRPAAGCERPRETYLPPKNRVGGFSATSPHRARLFASQPLETHWENEPTPTTTASGVSFYGYRFYNPELGRWINRDPLGESAFRSVYQKQVSREERRRLSRLLRQGEYRFVDNNALRHVDPHGLQFYEPPIGGHPWDDPYYPPSTPIADCLEKIIDQYKKFAANLGSDTDEPVLDDKLQHCISSCELAEECGEAVSWLLGFAKEVRDELLGEGASTEDFLNNFIGHDCAGSDEGCEECCKCNYQP